MRLLKCILFCGALLAAFPVFAGGPFVVDTVNDSGVAQQWTDNMLTWYSEDGDLANTVNNTTAKQWITDLIDQWTGASLRNKDYVFVKTTNVGATYAGSVGKDVNSTNYDEYISAEPGPTLIIFDKDGSITKLFAPGSYRFIPGLSQLLLSSADGKKILKGVIILNGILLNEGTLTEQQFKAAMLHELGHLFNLDHTQINLDIADRCDLGGTCTDAQYIPTMFPELKTYRQNILSADDKITVSWIYPNSTFNASFCTITGEIQDQDGNPLQGVNVIARRVSDGESLTKEDARSMVSGVLFPACHPDGHYYLHGIIPGKTYEVIYEPLASKYSGMSGFEPLANPPTGFDTAVIPASGGATTVTCAEGGQSIQMQTVQVSVANPCATGDVADETTETTKSGGCSLILSDKK